MSGGMTTPPNKHPDHLSVHVGRALRISAGGPFGVRAAASIALLAIIAATVFVLVR
jgi:hypothetical protein